MKTCVFQYAIATLAVILFAFVYSAEAKIVYTPVGATISGSGSLQLDLNHDKKTDFTVASDFKVIQCPGQGYGAFGLVTVTPTTGNGVVGNSWASALGSGASIASSSSFFGGQAIMTQFSTCLYPPHTNDGVWLGVSNRYLGLEFNLNGQIHYGWAEMSVGLKRGRLLTVTLTGFAYESVPGTAIKAGQESGASDDPSAPDASETPGGTATADPIPNSLQPASLATAAFGTQGVSLRRRRATLPDPTHAGLVAPEPRAERCTSTARSRHRDRWVTSKSASGSRTRSVTGGTRHRLLPHVANRNQLSRPLYGERLDRC